MNLDGTNSCLYGLKHVKPQICYVTFWGVLNELCLTLLSDPIGILFGLQPDLDPDVQPVRTKVMGIRGECCVFTLR